MTFFSGKNKKRAAAAALSMGAFLTVGSVAYADVWSDAQGKIDWAGYNASNDVSKASNLAAGTISKLGPTITYTAFGTLGHTEDLANKSVNLVGTTTTSTANKALFTANGAVANTQNIANGAVTNVGTTAGKSVDTATTTAFKGVDAATNIAGSATRGASGIADSAGQAGNSVVNATSPIQVMATEPLHNPALHTLPMN